MVASLYFSLAFVVVVVVVVVSFLVFLYMSGNALSMISDFSCFLFQACLIFVEGFGGCLPVHWL